MTGADTDVALDRLMPMHLRLDAALTIRHAGPVLLKLARSQDLTGRGLTEFFDLDERVAHPTVERLAGRRLNLALRARPEVRLRGLLAPYADGAIMNAAPALSGLDRLRDHGLELSDFAATDALVDLLFLIEARSLTLLEARDMVSRLEEARRTAESQAVTDSLTGLSNRRALNEELERLTGRGAPFALMRVDLDDFKHINDTFGHASGDSALRAAARALLQATRRDDTVARMGGDEFVVLLADVTSPARVERVAERVLSLIRGALPGAYRLSCSLGSTLSVQYARPSPARLLRDADVALYAAKAAGRDCHKMFRGAAA